MSRDYRVYLDDTQKPGASFPKHPAHVSVS